MNCAIVNEEQAKSVPFIELPIHQQIETALKNQAEAAKAGKPYADNIYILGQSGSGKTATAIRSATMLKELGIQHRYIQNLPAEAKANFFDFTGIEPSEIASLFVLIADFPDKVRLNTLINFLDMIWHCMITKNYNKISFLLVMNKSHYCEIEASDKNLVLGKFRSFTLQPLSISETARLIQARLETVGMHIDDFISTQGVEAVYNYTKGVPRNIIRACATLFEKQNGLISDTDVRIAFCASIFDQIIDDHTEDDFDRKILKEIVHIIEKEFNMKTDKKEDFTKLLTDRLNIGRPTVTKHIAMLVKWRLLSEIRSGDYRTKKRLVLGDAMGVNE